MFKKFKAHLFFLAIHFPLIALSTTFASSAVLKVEEVKGFGRSKAISLAMPTDVTVGENSNVYVVDGVNNRILVFSKAGEFVSSFGGFGNSSGQFNSPLGIATGKNGTIYIADTGNKRVQIFSPHGKFLKAIDVKKSKTSRPPDITDIALDIATNRLYICDNDNHQILVYDDNKGIYLNSIGSQGKARMMFRYPFLISVSQKGYLLVAETINTRVQVINPKGNFVSFIGKWGLDAGQLYRPKGVAVMGETVFVSDSYLGRIQAFTLSGKFIGELVDTKGAPLELETPTGIATDTKNKILYVVELKPGRIRSFKVK